MKIQLFTKGIPLPKNAVTQKFSFIGTSGGGKTYGAQRLAEEFWDIGAQFVVLDPVGVWYGLRLDKSGKKPSDITIPVFGGLHGDIPLEPTSGKLMADLVVDKNITAVLDVSQFESDADKARFVADFLDRFFFRKKAAPSAVHIFMEECQEFVPQNPYKGEERMLHAAVRLQKIGRNFGIGTSLITQRPQEVSKKALNLAGTLFAFRTTGAHERKAIEMWMQDNSVEESDIIRSLPSLETGAPHVWSPEFLKISQVVKIKEKRTFDASATPEVGAKAVARHLGSIDLEKVQSEMKATIEKAKAEDPKELHKEIKRLSSELAKKQPSNKPSFVNDPKSVERALVQRDKEWEVKMREANKEIQRLATMVDKISLLAGSGGKTVTATITAPAKSPTHPTAVGKPIPIKPLYIAKESVSSDSSDLSGPEKKIINAIAWFESIGVSEPEQTAVAFLAGYTFGGGAFNNPRGALRTKGMIEYRGDKIALTESGRASAETPDSPLTQEELHEKILSVLETPHQRILKPLLQRHPDSISNEELAELAGYSIGGAFNNPKGRLRTMGLIEYLPGGKIRARDILFI